MTNPDPEGISFVRLIIASLSVLGLLGLFAYALRYVSAHGWKWTVGAGGERRRLKLKEFLPLDARHRLVIVQCDDTEHLLMLGPNQDTVVASPLPAPITTEKK